MRILALHISDRVDLVSVEKRVSFEACDRTENVMISIDG
jgi:hypothetical protein